MFLFLQRSLQELCTSLCESILSECYFFTFAGFNVDTLPVYAKRSQRMVITARMCTVFNQYIYLSYIISCNCSLLIYNTSALNSSSNKCSSGPKSPHSWTEAHSSTTHPQPLPRFPRSSYIHQNTSKSSFVHLVLLFCHYFQRNNR